MMSRTAENISQLIPFEEPTVDRPTKIVFTICFLQKKSIIAPICNDLVRSFPKIFKFAMFTFLFVPCVPFQHYVSYFKSVSFFPSIIYPLNSLLQLESVLKYLLSSLLQMNHLIDPPLQTIIFVAGFLQKFDHWDC